MTGLMPVAEQMLHNLFRIHLHFISDGITRAGSIVLLTRAAALKD